MKFLSLEPFVPSGSNFQQSKEFFVALGFTINWDGGDYIGFEKDGCKFILQKYDVKDFAENFMISVSIDNAQKFWDEVNDKQLIQKFGIRITKPKQQPYGIEVNVIDLAGVCWHFVQS
jgi:predicted lactoylglutathione lyase